MTRRSAPFVAPDFIDDALSKDGKKQAKALLSTLQEDIARFRDDQFPPDILRQIRDLPIFEGNLAEVQAYQERWRPLIDRAMGFYPSAYLPPDFLPLPASLEIPQFIYHVQKLHLTKTRAKESKSFGSVGALIDKCGEFTATEIARMEVVLQKMRRQDWSHIVSLLTFALTCFAATKRARCSTLSESAFIERGLSSKRYPILKSLTVGKPREKSAMMPIPTR